MRYFLFSVLVVASLGCDQRAKVAGASVMPPGRVAPGKLRESCAATSDCEDPLRCVEGSCRSASTSRLGDYYWALGQITAEKNKFADAADAFQQAVGHFDDEKLDAPPALLCDAGAAMRKNTKDASAPEKAARLLHRCLLGTAVGAADHMRALRELAELDAFGLDPTKIALDKVTDSYLTRAPKAPQSSEVKLEVAQTKPSGDRGYAGFVALLATDPVKKSFQPCFDKYVTASQKTSLSFPLNVALHVQIGDDDMYVGGSLDVKTDPATTGPELDAARCVSDAIKLPGADFASHHNSSDSWSGTVTLTLSGSN
jgi:hypothetical protein